MENGMTVRWNQLKLLTKEELIGIYLRGVRQPNGNVIASAGPAANLRKWRKAELIISLLDIGWPGSYTESQ